MLYVAYFDGSASPNPGQMCVGGWIKRDDHEIKISEDKGYGTNNQAEYLALIEVLKKSIELGIKEIIVFGDSKLVVNQVNGNWKIKNPNVKDLALRAKNLVKKFNKFDLRWVEREYNIKADILSKGGN
jgi:ribonuclease HI